MGYQAPVGGCEFSTVPRREECGPMGLTVSEVKDNVSEVAGA